MLGRDGTVSTSWAFRTATSWDVECQRVGTGWQRVGRTDVEWQRVPFPLLMFIRTTWLIYQCAANYMGVLKALFGDFRDIALGAQKPFYNEELYAAALKKVSSNDDALILKCFFDFNCALRVTNFFKKGIPGAFAFRFAPERLIAARPKELFPEAPFGVYMVMGRGFMGWHVRFREIARGGIRCVKSINRTVYTRNAASLFEETYNLAYTQQRKNKDIAEGGSKGTILLDSTMQHIAKDAFLKYVDALIDVMMCDGNGRRRWVRLGDEKWLGRRDNPSPPSRPVRWLLGLGNFLSRYCNFSLQPTRRGCYVVMCLCCHEGFPGRLGRAGICAIYLLISKRTLEFFDSMPALSLTLRVVVEPLINN